MNIAPLLPFLTPGDALDVTPEGFSMLTFNVLHARPDVVFENDGAPDVVIHWLLVGQSAVDFTTVELAIRLRFYLKARSRRAIIPATVAQ
jgi:hypothetical protein